LQSKIFPAIITTSLQPFGCSIEEHRLLVSEEAEMDERILVVDDDRDTADTLARLIRSLGYETQAVYSGEQATRMAADFGPELVLMDVGMPRLNGYETAARIRKLAGCQHTILVALTGWTNKEDKVRAYESGFDLHVAKPISLEGIKELLNLLEPAEFASAADG
jgi:CheY-like chemotaxis protein